MSSLRSCVKALELVFNTLDPFLQLIPLVPLVVGV
jgi:hypothetical protein